MPVKSLVSVITPTIPSRAAFLEECKASVAGQTTEHPYEHLVRLDDRGEGNSVTTNRLASEAKGDWLLPIADDDLLCPGALRILLANSGQGDIIWARPLVWGNDSPHLTQGQPPKIPSFGLIKTELWYRLGGYDENITREEDRGLWQRALDVGAEFHLVEEGPVWIYRFHGGNKSYNGGRAQ